MSPHQIQLVNAHMSVNSPRYEVIFSLTFLHGVLNKVRNSVLDWALNLEKAGIVGGQFSFSTDEQQKARATPMTFNIGNIGSMVGNLGSGNNSGDIAAGDVNVQVAADLAKQSREHSAGLVSSGADERLLSRAIEGIERQAKLNPPDKGAVRGFLQDLRNSLSGAAGSLIASGLIFEIGKLLG